MRGRWLVAAGLTLACPPARAELAAGDLFVSEAGSGSVANARAGGDLGGAPRFATGLDAPSGLCVTEDRRLLAAESASGEVTDITAGGDFTGAEPFASGLDEPRGLLCGEDEILVVEAGTNGDGEITDITAGGDFTGAVPFASGLGPGATALLRAPGGELFASAAGTGQVFDVTSGGAAGPPFATTGAGTAGLAGFDGSLLAANPGSHQIVSFDAGGDLTAQPVFATLPGVVALLPVPGLGLLAASAAGGTLVDATAGGDLTGAASFASGLSIDPAFAGLARVGGCGDGVVEGREQCDDGNTANGDGCDSRCIVRLCLVPPPSGCIEAAEGRVSIRQKGSGDHISGSFSLELGAFAEGTTALDFGNPVFDTTRFDLCVYGEGNRQLVGQLIVDRGFDVCGPKETTCWKLVGDAGYRYKDKDRIASGVGEMVLVAGPAGGGELRVTAKRTKKNPRMPRMTETLANDSAATIRLMSSDGRCLAATLGDVQRADDGRFVARTP